jgi:hypothetical protein
VEVVAAVVEASLLVSGITSQIETSIPVVMEVAVRRQASESA